MIQRWFQVLGASWYLASIGRQHSCWDQGCKDEYTSVPPCNLKFLDCESSEMGGIERQYWLNSTSVLSRCDASNDDSDFKFGMFADAFTSEVASSIFIEKYIYCLWWGLRNLRCECLETNIWFFFWAHIFFYSSWILPRGFIFSNYALVASEFTFKIVSRWYSL